jgi:hypothetical protein
MNHLIYHLRNTQMNDKLQAQLAGIISSYRPHDEPPKLDELHRERVDKSHCNMVDLAKDVGITYATKK